jgi:hypothetical protein
MVTKVRSDRHRLTRHREFDLDASSGRRPRSVHRPDLALGGRGDRSCTCSVANRSLEIDAIAGEHRNLYQQQQPHDQEWGEHGELDGGLSAVAL